MGLFPARSALVLAGVIAITGTLAAGPAPNADATPATTGDFSGVVDIGGRSLYLECRGQGSPTVILEAGANGRGDVWSRDNQQPAGQRTMVLPGVAAFSRVCSYDRPGTTGEVNPDLDPDGPLFLPSRSDPVPQPRMARDMVADCTRCSTAPTYPGPMSRRPLRRGSGHPALCQHIPGRRRGDGAARLNTRTSGTPSSRP